MTPDVIIRGKDGLVTKIELTQEEAERVSADLVMGNALHRDRPEQLADKAADIIVALVTSDLPQKIKKP
ncbi:MAG TPA: hypothetical protein VI795_01440 [Patescibacteria group bacterium]|nr:hypothetical protein [Patescibacteria group bacterium]